MNGLFCALLAAKVLFPAENTNPEGYDGAQVRVEDGAAVVDVAPDREFSGVNFVFQAPLALNRCDLIG